MELLVSILPIIAIFGVFWLLILRPASNRQKALRAVQTSIQPGDTVITSSGIFGDVRSIDGDKIGLEIADGVVITVARAAVVGLPDEEREQTPVEDRDDYDEPVDPTADDNDRDR
ncbi:MAG: preprotein translocase subunit YajC [Nocardioides sp.]|nr:preprotein translocase subunit YajC [Nocardioides sp.]